MKMDRRLAALGSLTPSGAVPLDPAGTLPRSDLHYRLAPCARYCPSFGKSWTHPCYRSVCYYVMYHCTAIVLMSYQYIVSVR